jgi:hypothetical protein
MKNAYNIFAPSLFITWDREASGVSGESLRAAPVIISPDQRTISMKRRKITAETQIDVPDKRFDLPRGAAIPFAADGPNVYHMDAHPIVHCDGRGCF